MMAFLRYTRLVEQSILSILVLWNVCACARTGYTIIICDRIWENPAYRENAQAAQCAFLVPQIKKCQSRVFVIFISKNLSINLCHHLRRVNVSYQGKISLHFDLPSLYGSCTRSPLLWALIRILYLDTAKFIKLLYIRSPF